MFVQNTKCENRKTLLTAWASRSRTLPPRGRSSRGANLRALQGGVTTDKNFDFGRELRKDVIIPRVFMTYANVVFSYGTAAPEHIGAYVKSMKDALR